MPDSFSVLILGGTDLTLRVADTVRDLGIRVAGVYHVGKDFEVSYAPAGVRNTRHVDIEGWCEAHGVPSVPHTDNARLAETVRQLEPSFGLISGWYHMVPGSVRALFPAGCAGLHASLLPKLRGGAPLNWAILTGAQETGLTLFELTDGVDEGPVYGQVAFPIGPRTHVGELVEASGAAADRLLRECLPGIATGTRRARPQEGTPTYGLQRCPADGIIDWNDTAESIDRLVRAVSRPYPGAMAEVDGRKVLIWRTVPGGAKTVVHGAPGQILHHPSSSAVGVVTGGGFLWIEDATFEDASDALPALAGMNHRRFG